MSYHLINTIQKLGHPKILVLGDLILDRYIWGNAERISQEAPVILLREDAQEVRLGGAANVANMLIGLDAEVTMAGAIGSDLDGVVIKDALEERGVDCSAMIHDASRPTTVKQRFMGRAQQRHPHQILRVDREVNTPLDQPTSEKLLKLILPMISEHKAILVSDYAKGVCTPEILAAVLEEARRVGVPVIVDPCPGRDYQIYSGATAITPNRLETSRAVGFEVNSQEDAFRAGRQLCSDLQLDYVFVTLDSDGIALTQADGLTQILPTRKREVYDITGAGDMVLATIGVGSAARFAPVDLARLANVAGGLEVEQIGVVTISREEMIADLLMGSRVTSEKILPLEELKRHLMARQKLGQKVVLTNGCFDVMHVGHVTYLEQAAAEGDCLIVAVNSDSSVRSLNKGTDRPIFGQAHRASMLAALEGIDYVVVFEETTPCELISLLKPDLLVKGGTYKKEEIVGWDIVESYGGEVRTLGVTPGISTTQILGTIRSNQEHETGTTALKHPIEPPRRKAG
ncbi:MAG: bifunctional heptose 7-phosphate kinase/heptose 1-phosphate adenyltransferase [Planctomycetes bacterium]|nr:bifunctional heptose 7-phosphate kinase/heptose 1-phosphate adenyltransferase [Planctomycetota bacterium]MCH9777224.1 bifunctional heptose 7-phosphate kinase/heptose 1-phosphate adenyltransferase [Planctomycetota bacterium]MCH9790062.1 bifunctional heptose 7-phosphate kinase/heptose 1-phosphate adenyltransferase [Planctomycetota bacterium]